ncbi:CPBP family intramembrane metalloprotease (plasmid) [Halarchaeum sp. CBA1220]|uniref:CPBP family intramembrane glutamic endopeptidase n=1 Tax=Halarchaeum sp. CBA1220 TaxID=1853682 RepID=UPI000F3AA3A9|nr:type II CAAX endopeptidase family protein [Halarchaeum sp. CBA1220]QLC35667.1 CPBP family intramembrane metalloprotease [Halarchaeum sp. CBA1220]
MNDASKQVRSISVAVALAIVGFGIGALLVAGGAGLLVSVGMPIFERPALQLVLSATLLQGVAFGSVALAYTRLVKGSPPIPVTIPSRGDIAWAVGGSALTLILWVGLSMTVTVLGLDSATNQVVTTASENPAVLLLMVPLSYLLVGPGEELLFRGVIQGRLRSTLSPVVAISLASAIFALLHVSSLSGEGKFVYLGGVFLVALVLGTAYERTGNLSVPVFIHATYNAIQFTVAYLTLTPMTGAFLS